MCLRVYTHFERCHCQLFARVYECEHGPLSPECGHVFRTAIVSRANAVCFYHARINHLRKGMPPRTMPLPLAIQLGDNCDTEDDGPSLKGEFYEEFLENRDYEAYERAKKHSMTMEKVLYFDEFETSDEFMSSGWDVAEDEDEESADKESKDKESEDEEGKDEESEYHGGGEVEKKDNEDEDEGSEYLDMDEDKDSESTGVGTRPGVGNWPRYNFRSRNPDFREDSQSVGDNEDRY